VCLSQDVQQHHPGFCLPALVSSLSSLFHVLLPRTQVSLFPKVPIKANIVIFGGPTLKRTSKVQSKLRFVVVKYPRFCFRDMALLTRDRNRKSPTGKLFCALARKVSTVPHDYHFYFLPRGSVQTNRTVESPT
jgi:hypothetical protein